MPPLEWVAYGLIFTASLSVFVGGAIVVGTSWDATDNAPFMRGVGYLFRAALGAIVMGVGGLVFMLTAAALFFEMVPS